jgi:hypothetical protein
VTTSAPAEGAGALAVAAEGVLAGMDEYVEIPIFVKQASKLCWQGGPVSMSLVWQNRPMGPGVSIEAQEGGGPCRPG